MFKKYLDQTGIAMAFQVIFAEILDKKIEEQKLFGYTAMRLRQIGEDLEKIKMVHLCLYRTKSDVWPLFLNITHIKSLIALRVGADAWPGSPYLFCAFLSHSHQDICLKFWRANLGFNIEVAASPGLFGLRGIDWIFVVPVKMFSFERFIEILMAKGGLIKIPFEGISGLKLILTGVDDISFVIFIMEMSFGWDIFPVVFGRRTTFDLLHLESNLIGEGIDFRHFLLILRAHQ